MLLSHAVEGFILAKRVEGLSPRTLASYERQLTLVQTFLDNPAISDISTNQLRQFLDYLRNDYTPNRLTGNSEPLSSRTIRNYWIVLRSFYTWATTELDVEDVMDALSPPKAMDAVITPVKPEDVQAMLEVCLETKDGRQHPNGYRNRAILLTLIDTGMRATELCELKIADYDERTGRLDVRNGKGGKGRVVFLGTKARKALWRYLVEREDRHDPEAPLFATIGNRHLSRSWLRKVVVKIANKAGVKDIHPHRLRHFFAIQYLRNSGDIFTLQRILGHSSLDMVKRYLAIADVDAERVHKLASPADNL